MAVIARIKNLGVSPLKARKILDVIRGEAVDRALVILQFMPSPTAHAIAKAVKSAAANAENNNFMAPRDLHVVGAYADDGMRLRRFRPRARGRADRIIKRHSHVTIVVDEKEN
ncbi:MAG: large subunit ribosomal protein L22 [Chloroflexi bacterium]|jgi:large subunit ribosomal protein L22|nr:MAG: large subunit ribosomal protein L22 [Chloroflexota bacterium]